MVMNLLSSKVLSLILRLTPKIIDRLPTSPQAVNYVLLVDYVYMFKISIESLLKHSKIIPDKYQRAMIV